MMKRIELRPLAFACASFLFLTALFFFLSVLRRVVFIGIFLLCTVFSFLSRKRKIRSLRLFFLLCTVFSALSFFNVFLRHDCGAVRLLQLGEQRETVTVTGRVTDVSVTLDYLTEFTVRTDTVCGEPFRQNVSVTAPYFVGCEQYDTVSLQGTVSSALSEAETMSSRLSAFSKEEMVLLTLTGEENQAVTGHDEHGIGPFFTHLREKIGDVFDRYLSEESAALLKAVFLGEKDGVGASVRRDFRRLGLSHILAVSGLHFTILMGAADLFLQRLRMGRVPRSILLIVFVLFYIGLTGAPASVVRAGIMLLFCYVSYLVKADNDSFTSLSVAAFFIVLFRPYAVFDLGFILSFLATFGILYVGVPSQKRIEEKLSPTRFRFLRKPASALAVTLSAILFTLPVSSFLFGEFSVFAPVCNLVSEFITMAWLVCSPLLVLLSPISAVANGFGDGIGFVTGKILSAISRIAGSGISVLSLRETYAVVLTVLFCGAVLFLLLRGSKKGWFYGAFGAFFTLLIVSRLLTAFVFVQDTEVYFENHSRSDVVAAVRSGNALIADVSDGSYTALRHSFSFCESAGATEIETYLITSYHTRTVASLRKLSERYVFRRIVCPAPQTEEETQLFERLTELGDARKIEIECYDPYTPYETVLSGFEVRLLPAAKISRSERAVSAFSVGSGNSAVCYCSGAFAQAAPYFRRALVQLSRGCSAVVIGSSGPIIKETPDVEDFSGIEIFTSCDLLSDTVAPDHICQKLRISMP